MRPGLIAVPVESARKGVRRYSAHVGADQAIVLIAELLLLVLALGLLVPVAR